MSTSFEGEGKGMTGLFILQLTSLVLIRKFPIEARRSHSWDGLKL